MHGKLSSAAAGLLLVATTAWASTQMPGKVLRVYGPGGPHRALTECADLYEEKHGIPVVVTKALPHDLALRLPEDGDIYYGGAECMLEEFVQRNPGVLDLSTLERLHPRRIGIIVRKGNPLNIRGIEDLHREGVEILDVKLENMRHFHSHPSGKNRNVRYFEYTGQQGVAAWLSNPRIDAWVTYRSWHLSLEESTDFVEIPGEHAQRFTPIAVTHKTPHREEALKFLAFLKSDEARKVFVKHGWD